MSSDGTKLIAGVSYGRLYISTDTGNTWTETQPAGDVNKYWYTTSMSSDGTKLIAGVFGGRLYLNNEPLTVELISFSITNDFTVKQNYPNPFNPTTKIEYSIPADNNVEIKVFDVLGMEVATIINEHKQAGIHSVEFNASNLPSGIYFYKVVSGNYSDTKKMILLR